MEQLVSKNFQAMKEFEEHLLAFRKQDVDRSSVEEILLSHFEEFFEKVSFFSLFIFFFCHSSHTFYCLIFEPIR
jgi:hypothetical protein